MAHEVPSTESEVGTEQQDRGLFGLFGNKKEERPEAQCHHQPAAPHQHQEVHADGYALPPKLHRTHSSSSSSSSGEDESGEKKEGGRKKKGLKEKIKEKLPGHHADANDGNKKDGQCQAHDAAHKPDGEKKGVLEKIKEKLPGHHGKETEEGRCHQEKQKHGY